jgi:L-lactate dehydrogenase complex protein LldG
MSAPRTSGRQEILDRIAAAHRDHAPAPSIPRDYHGPGQALEALGGIDLIGLFEEQVLDYRADVHRCTPAGIGECVASVLAGRGISRIVVPAGVPGDWYPAAIQDDPPLRIDQLDALDGVLTSCAVAVAQTGTIVLDHGSGQGRRALTLVPDHHLVVVRADQIVYSVPDAIAALAPERPMTWISGPSATSDIELSRVEGVHGPRKLDVLLVT